MLFEKTNFKLAKPIWEKDKDKELNYSLLFEVKAPKSSNAILRIAGNNTYRIFINGSFVYYGPARAGRGYYRVDELSIEKWLTQDENTITVLSMGYYCYNYQFIRQPAFLCAEIESEGKVISHTGDNNWKAYSYPEKIQKVQRYSGQRTFAEVYDYRNSNGDLLSSNGRQQAEIMVSEDKNFIVREISYPDFDREAVSAVFDQGKAVKIKPEKYFYPNLYDNPLQSYPKDEIKYLSVHMGQEIDTVCEKASGELPLSLSENSYACLEMKSNTTGLIEIELYCNCDTDIYLTFDELLTNNKINLIRNKTSNIVIYRLKGGNSYRLITAEPYTFKYLNVISLGGEVELSYAGIIRTDFNKNEIIRSLNTQKADEQIKRIYDAAIETFRQNTFDIYMDCPSRERAGWLCDSFFTSRVEKLLSGKSTVEKCFLSNFAMEKNHKFLPEGMLPMCYPAEQLNERYIPNWAMWYVLQLGEYFKRTNDEELVAQLREKCIALASFFKAYENEDGLLQNLDSWVFVEWSMCNKLVQDINYPSNMLYYKFKLVMYQLYGDEKFKTEADNLRKVIREKSRMGLFFCDNSVFDENGNLKLSGQCTETCQYYAFYMGVATIEEDRELWETMVKDFGPERKENGKWPEIHFANSFIGNYLRLDLLADAGEYTRLEENIRGYFDYMAKLTGTLWEHDKNHASCNHGFASHVLIWLDKLGYIN